MLRIQKSSLSKYKGPLVDTVSIIITYFNKELTLEKAILSCLAQTHKRIEVIVIDDNSNKEFCKKIVKKIGSKKVRLFSTSRNYGHYACSNYGLDAAKGKYVTFLGADDTISPSHVADLLKAIKLNRLMAACSLYSRFDTKGSCIKKGIICEASILFDRKIFLRDIGYFHMVRCAADSEYRERAIAYYGDNKIGSLQASSYKALQLPGSLTVNKETRSHSPERGAYVRAFRSKHKLPKASLRFDYKKDLFTIPVSGAFCVKGFDLKTFMEIKA